LKKSYSAEGISDDAINYYIQRFKEIKGRSDFQRVAAQIFPYIKTPKDILIYKNFKDLERLVDIFPHKIESNDAALNGGESVYNKNGLEIYRGSDKNSCVKYGNGYSWCISRKSSGNLFNTFRYDKNIERMFYFVFDRNLPKTDPQHAIVIHVYNNGKYGYSDANNKGDINDMSWNGIIKEIPKLKNLKKYFIYVPISGEERDIYDKIKKSVPESTENLLDYFKDYKLVEKYIDIGHLLSSSQFGNLSDELQENYFIRHPLTPEMYQKMTFKNKNAYLKKARFFYEGLLNIVSSEQELKILKNRLQDSLNTDSISTMAIAIPILIYFNNEYYIRSYFQKLYNNINDDPTAFNMDTIMPYVFDQNIRMFTSNYSNIVMDEFISYNDNNNRPLFFRADDLESFKDEDILKYAKILERYKKIPMEEIKKIYKVDKKIAVTLLLAVKEKILAKNDTVKDRILNYYKKWIGTELVEKIFAK